MSKLARGSARKFCVCIAMVLMRKMGRPRSSNAKGITDPNGNPACFREWVERLPMRPKCVSVRARSAYAGSGTGGCPLAGPVSPCFLADDEVIRIKFPLRTISLLLVEPVEESEEVVSHKLRGTHLAIRSAKTN